MSKPRNPLLTPANIVTCIRIILIPVFVYVLLAPWPTWMSNWENAHLLQPWIAAAVYAILASTDAVDGYLARSRNEVTTLGKFLDPLADKILVAAALLALCELGTLSTWIALIILAREFIVSGLRMVASVEGVVIAASWYGKWKTATTIVAIIMFIVKDSPYLVAIGEGFAHFFNVMAWVIMVIALILTIVSMVDYFAKANRKIGLFSSAPVKEEKVDAVQVIHAAIAKGVTLATAESCTGGMVGAALTSVPGSSEAYLGGIQSYANAVKEKSLGVSASNLEEFGAVSYQVAAQMAEGACKAIDADIAVSVTGIAGPGGGSDEKPVGTVWFGIHSANGTRTVIEHFTGNRSDVREASVQKALELLNEEIKAL